MNRLIVVNTYSQLIIALQMRRTLFAEDYVGVILSDHTAGTGRIFERLRDLDVFDCLYYKKTKCKPDLEQTLGDKFSIQFHLLFGHRMFRDVSRTKWDELIYYNTDPAIFYLYAMLRRKNPAISGGWFEEGILSYSTEISHCLSYSVMRHWFHLSRRHTLDEVTKRFYCFYPESYRGSLMTQTIPKISGSDTVLKNILKKVFSVQIPRENFSYRYLFFSSVYDFEGGDPIGELELLKKIAVHVGNDNLLVKVHPRDRRERFEECGLHVDENSSLPWEVIQLNYDFRNTIFLTAISGSVLFVNMLIECPSETYVLFPLCDTEKNVTATRNIGGLKALIEMDKNGENLSWLHVTDSLVDIG